MNVFLTISIFIFTVNQCALKCDTKTICRQRVLDRMEFVNCPPSNNEEYKDYKYCCSNNGRVSCCNYNDYQSQHNGPSLNTIYVIVIVEIVVVVLSVWWCCTCFSS